MPLVLRIENVDTLPDGGPVFVEIDRRGIDIGRDTFLDWTLPDPERFISGKHCEIHFRDGGYWLHDVSTNGTSINGQPGRLTEPHKLQHGDRIHIGPYIVLTELSGVEAGPGAPGPVPDKGGTSVGSDPWGGFESTAEAIDRRDFTARSQASSGNRPADLAEENISWGFGDTASDAGSAPDTSDWSAAPSTPPSATPPSDDGADWGAPSTPAASTADAADWVAPATPSSSGLESSENAADWGAPAEPAPPSSSASANAADWGAPPTPAATPANNAASTSDAVDWGATPSASDSAGAASPWDVSVPSELKPAPAAVPEAKQDAAKGDNPFLADDPKPIAAEEATPENAGSVTDGGAFGALSEPAKPQRDPTPVADAQPQPSGALSGQWAGGDQPEAAPPTATPPPAAVPTVGSPATAPAGNGSFIAAFERGAGLPAGAVAGRTDDALAEELGQLFRTMTQSLQEMLRARAETKSAMRSSERTMIGALENNPLKFSPTPEDAMRIMFGQKSKSYLDASQTIDSSFSDLQKHQLQTFGAMQSALQVLIEDLDPETIAGATAKDGGLAGLVSSRRAKFWDTYVERFKAKSAHHDRGMIDAFMILFAEMYDRQS